MNETFNALVQELQDSSETKAMAKKGLCRVWTSRAVPIIQKFLAEHSPAATIEVREVEVEPFLLHTFIRIILDKEMYIADGTGAGSFNPFFGLETEVPHLQNSDSDPLHYTLLEN